MRAERHESQPPFIGLLSPDLPLLLAQILQLMLNTDDLQIWVFDKRLVDPVRQTISPRVVARGMEDDIKLSLLGMNAKRATGLGVRQVGEEGAKDFVKAPSVTITWG